MSIGKLEEYRVEVKEGEELINHGLVTLPNGRQLAIKSILGVKKTNDGKTIVWGRGREIPRLV